MNKEFEMKESLDFAISGVEIEIADKSVQMALDAVGGGDLTDYAFVDDLEVEGALVGDCG